MKSTTLAREVKAAALLGSRVAYYYRPFDERPKAAWRATVREMLTKIKEGNWQQKIEALRKEKNTEIQKKLKRLLGAIIFAYDFEDNKPREIVRATKWERATGLITLDYDEVRDPGKLRDKLSAHPSVVAAFVSPRGNGLKVLVGWEGDGEEIEEQAYRAAWAAAKVTIDKVTGEKADPSGKDITRICYPSWDPKAYVAAPEKMIRLFLGRAPDPLLEKATSAEDDSPSSSLRGDKEDTEDEGAHLLLEMDFSDKLEKVKEKLAWIDPTFRGDGEELAHGITDDRDGWVKLCFAVVGTLGYRKETKELLREWSRNELAHEESLHYGDGVPKSYGSDKDFEVAWKSFAKKPAGRPAGMGTITNVAKACGWTAAYREEGKAEEWEKKLLRTELGQVKPNEVNTLRIMENLEGIGGLLKWNLLRNRAEWISEPQYDRAVESVEWNPTDAYNMASFVSDKYRVGFAPRTIDECVASVAMNRAYHPVRDYLAGLKWDGETRIDGWLSEAFGVAPSRWAQIVGRKWLLSAVARALRPGCKVDTMMILEGLQGAKKSSALRALAGADWFSDAHLVIGDKDGVMLVTRVWIYELPEMHAQRKAEVDLMKAFLSRQVDEYREPYGRTILEKPRGVVFVGTTNEKKYLRDPTGNRRFWPVAATKADLSWITANRDQIWAEARVAFEKGEKWWLNEEEEELAASVVEKRVESDPWVDMIANYVGESAAGSHSSLELLTMGLGIKSPTSADARRLANVMRALKWVGPTRVSVDGKQVGGFRKI